MNTQTNLFYNTIGLQGSELAQANASCETQEERVLKIMQVGCSFTPSHVHWVYNEFYPEVPITSIRRAMTNLTRRGLIRKTDEKEEGKYGKLNYKWIINTK